MQIRLIRQLAIAIVSVVLALGHAVSPVLAVQRTQGTQRSGSAVQPVARVDYVYDVPTPGSFRPHTLLAGTPAAGDNVGSAPADRICPPRCQYEAPGRVTTSHEGVATNTGADLPGLSASRAQLEAKFKHAADFGVAETRGAAGFDAFGKAVDSFVADSSTVRVAGTYRGNPAILNYNPASARVVVQATDGTFISGWQMSPAQLRSVITKASLGGG